MNANMTSDIDMRTVNNSGKWSTEHETGQWTIKGVGTEIHVVPHGRLGQSAIEYRALSQPTVLNQQFSLSRSPADTGARAHFSAPVNRNQFLAWYSNPIPVQEDIPQMFGRGTLQEVDVAQTTFDQTDLIGDRTLVKPWTVVLEHIDLDHVLAEVFTLAAGEHFEDGLDTKFSRAIGGFIKRHRLVAIDTFKRAFAQNLFRDTYVAEALLWIGEFDDDETASARRTLLENACWSDSPFLRDAAVSGLSYLGAADSIRLLESRLDIERVKGVRANIAAVLAYLRD